VIVSVSTVETYRAAAKEHLDRASQLFQEERYFLSHYLAGLAVECHLRAYLLRRTNQFEARHDLRELAKDSKFYAIVPKDLEAEFSGDFEMLNLRWRSNHRYYSEKEFLDYMTEIRAEFNTKGERWKNISRTVLNLAHKVINQGERKWNNA